jgi:hypothetical protein
MTFKEKVYQQYLQIIKDKILSLETILNDLNESAKNETKSTAGDKHETALAMLQIEQENTRKKIAETIEQKTQLERINIHQKSDTIIKGSLIKTDKGSLLLSIALGKIVIDEITITALSPQSPLGIKLLGLKMNDMVEINNNQFLIKDIL